MKKDRNCGGNYPIYPAYQMPNMMPGIPMNIPNGIPNMNDYSMNSMVPYNNQSFNQNPNNIYDQQLSNLSSQINSLERRVSNLESLVGNGNKYNTSNYQML